MLKQTVIDKFGTASGVARVLGITRQAVSQWESIVPEGIAYKVQAITGGDLSVDPAMYPSRSKSAPAPSTDAAA